MKKFIVIPILIIIYLFLVDALMQINFEPEVTASIPGSQGPSVIGVKDSISVSVTRAYLFGLIRLPVYTDSLGDIGIYHDTFFTIIFILTIALIIIEVKNRKGIKGRKYKRKRR